MDIAMPGLDGITATRHLRTFDPAARIVIVTNHDQPTCATPRTQRVPVLS